MFAWVNSALAIAPAILVAGRNGAINMIAGGGDGNISVTDANDSFCVFKENNTDSFITVKNKTSYDLNLSYYLIYVE